MATKKNPLRMVSGLGVGAVLGAVGWLAFNFIGIANQVSGVGQHFESTTDAPAAVTVSVSRYVFAPVGGEIETIDSEAELTQFDSDFSEPATMRENGQADYVAGFEANPSSARRPLPETGRLVMDPRMFVFEENDAELEAAFDELMFSPDDEIRQAAIENLLPAMGR